jgi:endonuclease III
MKPVTGQPGTLLAALRKQYGPIELPEPREPFALIVWENCAYLVDDERRAQTFEDLRKAVGITAQKLLAAGAKKIEAAIGKGGMQPPHRAAKVVRCAEIALTSADGDLAASLWALPEKPRRTLLKRFPGIADPGADKVLLLCGFSDAPALDSNGLRVLERLGLVATGQTYAAAYRAGLTALTTAGIVGPTALEAFALLRAHGRKLCKRTGPLCPACSLRSVCPSAR